MHCPVCRENTLEEIITRRSVLIDRCTRCSGVWLDRGEIFLLSRDPARLERRLAEVPAGRRPSDRSCPRCSVGMEARDFLVPDLEVDECAECEGIWFDAGELERALELDRRLVDLGADPMRARSLEDPAARAEAADTRRDERARKRLRDVAAGRLPLPNMFLRSMSVFVLLYALLGAVLVALAEGGVLTPMAALLTGVIVVGLHYALGPWMMDVALRWLYQCRWIAPEELPGHLHKFVRDATAAQKMQFPRFGLIDDGAPNAFTYGHTPSNMRVVISRGILELLEPEEAEAVVAHELGHGKHWDMALMTLAQLVPLVAYYTFRALIRVRSSGSGKDKGAAARLAIALVAYLVYIVSEYIVLWFSRCREYHADRFSGNVTGNPNALAQALVKIAYGLAAQGKPGEADKEGQQRAGRLDAVKAMGIFDADAARSLVVSATGAAEEGSSGRVSRENLKSAMQWDLWNPWARFHELHSTHPLVAHRLQYLADQSAAMGQEPYIVFDRKRPESYWDEFFVDLFVTCLPWLAGAGVLSAWLASGGAAASPHVWIGSCIAAVGLGSLGKTLVTYRGGFFAPLNVSGLLHKVKVSNVRPVPAIVKGTVIGRGVPGLIWSEDFVLRDRSGILFLDYRQPLRIWEWLFGLLRAGELAGRRVTVTGWYRRAPVPYLEIKTLEVAGETSRCYAYHAKIVTGAVAIAAGIAVALGMFGG
ncbi:MAG: M48 family metalloprotease [Planctomycetota bacterium]|jgi:Zn-dependent protease with chaperone function